MVYPINQMKEKFRNIFLSHLDIVPHGAFLTDADVKSLAKKHNLIIPFIEVQGLIRGLEDRIGITHKKRLKRVRNEGYLILEPKLQADTALREGKHKVQIALKKTSSRLAVVEVDSFTPEQRRELIARTSAIDSLLDIVKNSSITKKIVSRREVELLRDTSVQTKQIRHRKDD